MAGLVGYDEGFGSCGRDHDESLVFLDFFCGLGFQLFIALRSLPLLPVRDLGLARNTRIADPSPRRQWGPGCASTVIRLLWHLDQESGLVGW